MSFEKLKKMFEFQFLITDMQKIIVEQRNKNPQADLTKSIERVDKLIEIYNSFDEYYYAAHYQQAKNLQLNADLLNLYSEVEGLKQENAKLLKSLEWNQA